MELDPTAQGPKYVPEPLTKVAVASILRELKRTRRKRRKLKRVFWALFCLSVVGGIGVLAYFQIRTSQSLEASDRHSAEQNKKLEEEINQHSEKIQELSEQDIQLTKKDEALKEDINRESEKIKGEESKLI